MFTFNKTGWLLTTKLLLRKGPNNHILKTKASTAKHLTIILLFTLCSTPYQLTDVQVSFLIAFLTFFYFQNIL